MRGLFDFDLTALQNLVTPSTNVVINSVTLTQTSRGSNVGGSSVTYSLSSYGFDFVEALATWNNPAGNGADGTAGGTIGALLSSASAVPTSLASGGTLTWNSSPAFVAAADNALLGDAGLRLITTSTVASNFIRFWDETQGLNAPLLAIDFTLVAVPEPSSMVLLGLGLVAFAKRRRRQMA